MAYVYRHIRLDTLTPFYIGVGSDDEGKFSRANSKLSRNDHWMSIINKTEYRVDIIFNDLSWEDALVKEIEFISIYGRKNSSTGLLCNRTDGGEGFAGLVYSEETKKKMSIATKLPQRILASKANLQKAHDKIKNESKDDRIIRLGKISKSLLGSKRTDDQKLNMSKAAKGKKKSEAHKLSMSRGMKEDFASGKRKPSIVPVDKKRKKGDYYHSPESKIKIGLAGRGRYVSPETRQKQSLAHTGRKHSPESIEKMKRIQTERNKNIYKPGFDVFNLEMEFIAHYDKVDDISNSLKVSCVSIYKVLNGKRESISGYIYKRTES